ncbi:MAG: hybrid sensor histidine kinase/response regulator transcription factor [Chloroflexota bacterium]
MEIAASGERSLPLEVEQAIYRVLQESLSNIARRAEADSAQISLTMASDKVILSLTDNGRGFEPAAVSPRSLGLAGMKQLILGITRPPQRRGQPLHRAFRGEFDVLRLIAAGKSNTEIADALVIGESTVKTHIGNLLKKLHLDNRTQAAVYAWQQGIVRRIQR